MCDFKGFTSLNLEEWTEVESNKSYLFRSIKAITNEKCGQNNFLNTLHTLSNLYCIKYAHYNGSVIDPSHNNIITIIHEVYLPYLLLIYPNMC